MFASDSLKSSKLFCWVWRLLFFARKASVARGTNGTQSWRCQEKRPSSKKSAQAGRQPNLLDASAWWIVLGGSPINKLNQASSLKWDG